MNYISDFDYNKDELSQMLMMAKNLKAAGGSDVLNGKVLTCIFYNPSLRTLLSFQTGMQKLGGICNVLDMSDSRVLEYENGTVMDGDASEHIKEFIQVVSSYSDVIAIRKSDFIPNKNNSQALGNEKEQMLADSFFQMVVKYANVPVINMESNMFHPCQSLADMLTMQEKVGDVTKKKYVLSWAPHPKPLPLATPHSQLSMPCNFGMDVVLACPPEFILDANVMAKAKERAQASGGSFEISHEQNFDGADFVCAKSWMSLKHFGDWDKEKEVRDGYKDWMITPEKLGSAKFMHCLPIRRNVIASDEVLDGANSIVIDEAENRMWAQMGLLQYLLNN